MTEFIESAPSARAHNQLFDAAHPDWTDDHRRRVRQAFAGSTWAAAAYCDGQLIATIRVITDQVSFGLIADLLVHPDFRHQGLATTLLKMAAVAHPDYYLYADPQSADLAPLYQAAGFTDRSVWRHRPLG